MAGRTCLPRRKVKSLKGDFRSPETILTQTHIRPGMSSSGVRLCVCVTIGLGSGNKLLLLLDTFPHGENALDRKLHAIREAIVVVESERFLED